MPHPEIPDLFNDLRFEFTFLLTKWSHFQELFHSGQDNLDLLNNTAWVFFLDLNKLMRTDIILHVCRLTDPATTMLRGVCLTNLTISHWRNGNDADLERLFEDVDRQVGFFRTLRNKTIAHHDVTDPSRDDLYTREQIQAAIDSVKNVFQKVEDIYDIQPQCYDFVILPHNGVSDLMAVLRTGLSLQAAQLSMDHMNVDEK